MIIGGTPDDSSVKAPIHPWIPLGSPRVAHPDSGADLLRQKYPELFREISQLTHAASVAASRAVSPPRE